MTEPGIVDEVRDVTTGRYHRGGKVSGYRRRGQVLGERGDRQCVSCVQLGGQSVEAIAAQGKEGQVGSVSRERAGEGPADSRRRSGDQDSLVSISPVLARIVRYKGLCGCGPQLARWTSPVSGLQVKHLA